MQRALISCFDQIQGKSKKILVLIKFMKDNQKDVMWLVVKKKIFKNVVIPKLFQK